MVGVPGVGGGPRTPPRRHEGVRRGVAGVPGVLLPADKPASHSGGGLDSSSSSSSSAVTDVSVAGSVVAKRK